MARVLDSAVRRMGDRYEVEGSWSGNDTIWRTCLDLNRILLHGQLDASLTPMRARTVVNIVDAIVIGHGNGPLSPEPSDFRLLLGGEGSAAIDHVSALLLGYAPDRIAITRRAFDRFTYPLVPDASGPVTLTGDLGCGTADALLTHFADAFPELTYPLGWLDAVLPHLRDNARASRRPQVAASPELLDPQ